MKPLVLGSHELNVMIRFGPTLSVSFTRVATNDRKSIPLKLREKPLGEDHVLLFVELLSIFPGSNYLYQDILPHVLVLTNHVWGNRDHRKQGPLFNVSKGHDSNLLS